MRFIPDWLHGQLLRFAWYRRKCGIVDMSPRMAALMAECLQQAHDSAAFLKRLREPESTQPGPTTVIRVHVPNRYVRRVSSD